MLNRGGSYSSPLDKDLAGHDDCDVVVLSAATEWTNGAENLRTTLQASGFAASFLGLGQSFGGWPWRMRLYRNSCRALSNDPRCRFKAVVLLDAYDALCGQSWHAFWPTFVRLVTAEPLPLGSAVRSANQPRDVQRAVVVGTEAICQGCNCGRLDAWWARARPKLETQTRQKRVALNGNKFLNGGFVAGTPSAVADALDWVLEHGFVDDQVGMAAWACAHAELFVPDDGHALVRNVQRWSTLSRAELAGAPGTAFFYHFPGVRVMPWAWPLSKGLKAWTRDAVALPALTFDTPERCWHALLLLGALCVVCLGAYVLLRAAAPRALQVKAVF